MKSEYINAIEVRSRWLKWARIEGGPAWNHITRIANRDGQKAASSYLEALPAYQHALETGDTFFMNKNFCSLVENARSTIPDDIEFEMSWVHSPQGWMWIEVPFEVPNPELQNPGLEDPVIRAKLEGLVIRVSALGWFKVSETKMYFLCYQDFESYMPGKTGFGCWSHFTLSQGDKLIDRIHDFESKSFGMGAYLKGRESDMKHEMRWVYAAQYLMAQRLSHHTSVPVDRPTRRRHERANEKISPDVRVISLRRLEEDRPKSDELHPVDWQWQWEVSGHWRNQPYKDGSFKKIFIEAYIKGPENKPLKPAGHKIFIARR
jgi:hypothetical protein